MKFVSMYIRTNQFMTSIWLLKEKGMSFWGNILKNFWGTKSKSPLKSSGKSDTIETMNENLSTNQKGLNLIKESEGFEGKAYLCPANVWTIGYGHTKDVSPGDTITKDAAEELLADDLKIYEGYVLKYTKVALNKNQFSALTSFVYNVGPTNFKNSTLRRYLNKKRFIEASREFLRWNKAGGKVLPGLVKRREKERALFLS